MKVAAVDIGTNSMRMLIRHGPSELGRWVEVTGLGEGVDATGRFSDEAMRRTVEVLARFGGEMERMDVARRRAIATSASRDAANREQFFDTAESALGVRPEVISGLEEAALAYRGATDGLDPARSWVVSDIGGGSTELVVSSGGISVDMGSVRLTERLLPDRPPRPEALERAVGAVRTMLSTAQVKDLRGGDLIGIAGTWTSLCAISLDLDTYDRDEIHGAVLERHELAKTKAGLADLTVEETAAIPSLDPKRAPVILAGAVIAEAVMDILGAKSVTISEHDTLDAVASQLTEIP